MRRALRLLGQGETIFALSSGGVRAGVAVIRVSGPQAHDSITQLTKAAAPPARLASVRKLFDPLSGDMLDHALVLRFDEGHSFTGEAIAEFQVHGGNAVVSSVLKALEGVEGLRHAEPGEFTRRSFWNDRMDLTQVEGLSDLITAETEQQRKQALSYMTGKASKVYQTWKSTLLRAVAQIEAYIDFSEEENIEEDVTARVDQAGVRRATEAARQADLRVCVQDSSQPPSSRCSSLPGGQGPCHCTQANEGETLVILNKTDISSTPDFGSDADASPTTWTPTASSHCDQGLAVFRLSCKTEQGLPAFLEALEDRVRRLCSEGAGSSGTDVVITRERHRQHVATCLQYLKEAKEYGEVDIVSRAQMMRFALNELGLILGSVHLEDILDELFAEFCIGK
ncbi:hypothetical protein PTSG_02550 [Salpingoeca rosetta]|uniref:Uncharacterized protein n=1 Tax=Salpingoeca rosetta (strain ATCC 50818 / BSB-021) TaxID=946362 RepID=F2U2I3_SALR5|nr:uncharacterized protein PTSG_02550 [Salpingoeca rosetta]EGD81835.1 hypothetical protein PTSG_02550 [Salpingoeca rosetta]|eukprot:XP_004997039.1 hypothetical protein PTSG_02550 [Salpingoeca rosetta]